MIATILRIIIIVIRIVIVRRGITVVSARNSAAIDASRVRSRVRVGNWYYRVVQSRNGRFGANWYANNASSAGSDGAVVSTAAVAA